MPDKPITKKYLSDRCTFKDKTVIIAVDFDGLFAIVKQLDPSDQKSVFKIVDHEINPLNEDQIDSLLIYLPSEVKDTIDFIEMSKREKLDLVRENKGNLSKVIEKKGFNERVDLNSKKPITREEYSSALLWELIKLRANLT